MAGVGAQLDVLEAVGAHRRYEQQQEKGEGEYEEPGREPNGPDDAAREHGD